ncbi:hypothetical protein RFI_00359 [Reticulomyxa filosa]|uniref:Uncharacterized protein n=1 Tax=Reticulomyxa filosa TaxID=46433 RepID=X6PG84_RETFI|nr:hypothetical protein RFI_00359 [Reticulomyxa filosa]|eukprot:ETO36702.1 hypothetical protein RFI_00359 [Reticulomyxa filosa]
MSTIGTTRFFENQYPSWEEFTKLHPALLKAEDNTDGVTELLKEFSSQFVDSCSEYVASLVLELFKEFPQKNLRNTEYSGSIYVGIGGIPVFLLRIIQIFDTELSTASNKENKEKIDVETDEKNPKNEVNYTNDIKDRIEKKLLAILTSKLHIESAKVRDHLLQNALDYNAAALAEFESRHRKRYTMIEGISGAYAVRAVCYHYQGNKEKVESYISKLKSLFEEVMTLLDCELLYGRMGYVSAFLFIQNHTGLPLMNSNEVIRVTESVIETGKNYSKSVQSRFVWMWSWHDNLYFGGAHGVSGILYTMLNVPKIVEKYHKELLSMVEQCKHQMQLKSGNYASSPRSLNKGKDTLVHWCHGAPSFVLLFCKAYHALPSLNEKVASTIRGYAEECSEVVWKRGILHKGPGLCHGVGGNGFTFLTMYRSFNFRLRYLYQAFCFTSFLLNISKLKDFYATPDHPSSLFEGRIGGGMLVLDTIFSPRSSKFPCVE